MAVSGSTDFELDVSDYIEEAFERCGLEVRTGYDLKTAKRSLNLLLAEWANRGLNAWTIAQRSQALTESDGEYTIGTDVIDILSVVVRPIPENSTDVLFYDALTRMDDADAFTNTMEVPFRFYPCLAAGLAYYIAIKRSPQRVQLLKAVYEEEMERAIQEDRDRASFTIEPAYLYLR